MLLLAGGLAQPAERGGEQGSQRKGPRREHGRCANTVPNGSPEAKAPRERSVTPMQGNPTLPAAALAEDGSRPTPEPHAVTNGDGRLTWTVAEAARILGICRATAYARVKQGALPHIRLAGRILLPRKALLELLARANAPTPQGGEAA